MTTKLMIFALGLLGCHVLVTGCVPQRAVAPEFVAEPVVNVEPVNGAMSTIVDEGVVERRTYCPPLEEVARPTGPSFEIGITQPWSVENPDVGAGPAKLYTRYDCH